MSLLSVRSKLSGGLRFNRQNKHDVLSFLRRIDNSSVKLCFYDPQYREVLSRMSYGNEGARQKARARLPQMDTTMVQNGLIEIERVLLPSGHLLWWVDKFVLASGAMQSYLKPLDLLTVDLLTWEKSRIGMGYRTRRKCEYLVVLQKAPARAKGIWKDHSIPDVWTKEREIEEIRSRETSSLRLHPHSKPLGLQTRLIECVTKKNDVVIDPSAGGYSVMEACRLAGRNFLGCDLRRWR